MESYFPESDDAGIEFPIKVIVGLGNPGRKYENTRHNLGFEVVNLLGIKLDEFEHRRDIMISSFEVSSRKIVLLKPLTYMNRSGGAVLSYITDEGYHPNEILVICDDFNLDIGRIRLRRYGSDGGHNGLASIIESLNTRRFARLRIGIGPVPESCPAEDFVLERFADSELKIVETMIKRSAEAVIFWLLNGYERAAAQYNRTE